MLVNAHYEKHVEQLVEVAGRFAAALSQAGIEYRIVGGLAVYLHVNTIDPLAARLTRDIDAAIRRTDIQKIAQAYGCAAEALFFDVPLEVCLDRNRGRARVVPEEAVRAMAAKLVSPGVDEGFSRVTVVR